MPTVTALEIPPLLARGATLIHVLPEEHFERERLPGAVNASVYEMAFVAKVRERVPELGAPIIVYGAGGESLDSTVAAAKLSRAGYTDVHDFHGGLAAWLAAEQPVDGSHAPAAATEPHGDYVVDTAASVVRWTGRNLFNHHHGTVKLAGGRLELDRGVLRSARFRLDMNTIACEDLVDPEYNALLIRHLRDDDFFAVDRFPTAEFVCKSAEPLPESTEGTPNYRLHGALTVRGITQPLDFPAVIAAADPDHLTGQAQFEIDRTRFGSQYGSGRFFAALGKHVVNDHIHLHVKLQAQRG